MFPEYWSASVTQAVPSNVYSTLKIPEVVQELQSILSSEQRTPPALLFTAMYSLILLTLVEAPILKSEGSETRTWNWLGGPIGKSQEYDPLKTLLPL